MGESKFGWITLEATKFVYVFGKKTLNFWVVGIHKELVIRVL